MSGPKRKFQQQPYTVYTSVGGKAVPKIIYGFDDDYLLYSQGHPMVDGAYRSGGGFAVRHRNYAPVIGPRLYVYFNGTTYDGTPYGGYYNDAPIAGITSGQAAVTANDAMNAASSNGATGWKRARPGNPVFNAANFLAEARDLPSLPGRLMARVGAMRGLGGEYLNQVFGWMPLVGDLRKFYETQTTLDKRLQQLIRDNGRGIRRRATIEDSTTVVTSRSNYPGQLFGGMANRPPNFSGGSSYEETTTTTVTKAWFVGKYRYYIPDIGTSQWTDRARKALFGLNPTPEVVWNAMPWSWLIDWFGNFGDVIANATANSAENLTAEYAYCMRTTEERIEKTYSTTWNRVMTETSPGSGIYTHISPGGTYRHTARSQTIVKARGAASPFGFGVKFDGLSAYQLGVAAALGIRRW